jgi:hypothetical protein
MGEKIETKLKGMTVNAFRFLPRHGQSVRLYSRRQGCDKTVRTSQRQLSPREATGNVGFKILRAGFHFPAAIDISLQSLTDSQIAFASNWITTFKRCCQIFFLCLRISIRTLDTRDGDAI